MRYRNLVAIFFVTVGVFAAAYSHAVTPINDEQIKKRIVEVSIAAYPGPCACPFNQTRNGSLCGKRSAWSKPGGYAPICYVSEVTPEMVKAWRAQPGRRASVAPGSKP
ncbi:hypothetical protein KXR87_17350 [Yokenella regensburgei]|uniref:hypothetical protein n=1 Tax=Yokenella regensburgei TaxID=158877 RepID=UPI003F1919C8